MLQQAKEFDQKPNRLKLGNRLVLSLMPITAGYAIASAPALAATLSMSSANFLLNNFSHNPTGTNTEVNVNPFTNAAPGSSINTSAEAFSIFLGENPLAYNTTLSMGMGEGNSYLGTADSKAKVVGNFLVGRNESFRFDFFGNLELRTSIDTRLTESANAAGNIYFLVLDATDSKKINLLDYFLLSGNLSTPGKPDYLFVKKSNRVKLDNFSKDKSFGGKEESALASVAGRYQRSFRKPTNLTVIEIKENSIKQQAETLLKNLPSGGVESAIEALATEPILSDAIVAAIGTETSQVDTPVPTLSQNAIVSTIGNDPLKTQGASKSAKMSLGDIKGAIANNNKAQTWLKGKTQYTALLPDQIVKDLQVFSNVSSGAWVDPPTTYGIEYTIEGDAVITNILDFFTDDADDLFTVAAEGKILGQFSSGDKIDFAALLDKGVSSFTVTDINPAPGKALANFNFRPLFNTNTASLQARSFDKPGSKSIPEPGSVFSLLALGVWGVASRLFAQR